MGKIAKALGVGVKGHVTIAVSQQAYVPGQYIVGSAHLRVFESFEGDALVLSFIGMERLKWATRYRSSSTSIPDITTEKLELFRSELMLAPAQYYQQGDYMFPFQCSLPFGLSPSLSTDEFFITYEKRLRAFVDYKLKATLPVRGMFRADLEGKRLVQIMPHPNVMARSLCATQKQDVELLGMFKKGECNVSAWLRSDIARIGENVDIRCKIDNHSKKRIRGVRSLLYQDIKLKPTPDDSKSLQTAILSETDCVGFDSTGGEDIQISHRVRAIGRTQMLSSHYGRLFAIQYRIRVKCQYTLCPSTKIDFPLTILP